MGTPTVVIATSYFIEQGKMTAEVEGLPSLCSVEIPHPLAGLTQEVIEERARSIINEVILGLTHFRESNKPARAEKITVKPQPEVVRVIDKSSTQALLEINRLFYKNRWTDGFPIVPPTQEAVEWMLTGTDRNTDEVVSLIPPLWGKATVRNIAINAVMAGAEPAYLPVIITAVEAIADPAFAASAKAAWGAAGMQTTTGSLTPLLIVSGPVANDLKIESGMGCFGRGHKSNATIGRSLRLILINTGGSRIGINDMKCHGSAQEFTYCVAEREEHPVYQQQQNSWKPLNAERGYPETTSTVTAAAAHPPICINEISQGGFDILTPVVDTIASLGILPYEMDWEFILVLNQTHARRLADAGWTKDSIRQFLYSNAVVPWGKYKRQYSERGHPAWMAKTTDDSTSIHIVGSPDCFVIIVAGGECQFSDIIRCSQKSVTKEIKLPKNWGQILESSNLE